jgi:hypothetical protein
MFSNGMQGTQRKYKILWFVVDMHHRQRYFFICDCKQIVTMPGVKSRRKVAEEEESRGNSIPVFAFFAIDSTCRFRGRIAPIKAGVSKTFLPNERIS